MKTKTYLKAMNVFFIAFLLFSLACGSGENHKHHQHAQKDGNTTTSHQCAHCGMDADKQPQWAAVVTSKSGEQWFCSPRCMFQVVLDKENAPQDITKIEVTDYFNTQKIDAKTAFYVTGSDVMGAMGTDFIPFKDENSAKDFMKEHQGKKILKFEEISLAVVEEVISMGK